MHNCLRVRRDAEMKCVCVCAMCTLPWATILIDVRVWHQINGRLVRRMLAELLADSVVRSIEPNEYDKSYANHELTAAGESATRNQFGSKNDHTYHYLLLCSDVATAAIDWAIFGRAQDTSILTMVECASCISRSLLKEFKLYMYILCERFPFCGCWHTVLSFARSRSNECVFLWWNCRFTLATEKVQEYEIWKCVCIEAMNWAHFIFPTSRRVNQNYIEIHDYYMFRVTGKSVLITE